VPAVQVAQGAGALGRDCVEGATQHGGRHRRWGLVYLVDAHPGHQCRQGGVGGELLTACGAPSQVGVDGDPLGGLEGSPDVGAQGPVLWPS